MRVMKLQQIPVSVLSSALMSVAVFWYIGIVVLTSGEQSKVPLAHVSLFWLLVVCLCPLACLVFGFALVQGRRMSCDRFSLLDWCSFVLASGPVIYLGWFIIANIREYFRG